MIKKVHPTYWFFFASGFTALIFEVCWQRQTSLIFGNSSFASAFVIAAFMFGLALGSFVYGRRAERYSTPVLLRLYGRMELWIAVFAILFPILLLFIKPIYHLLYLAFSSKFILLSIFRFAVSFILQIFPTFCMGATFPLLCEFLSRKNNSSQTDSHTSKLYTFNLSGAVLGAWAAGYVLLPAIGLNASVLVACSVNFLIYLSCRKLSKTLHEDVSLAENRNSEPRLSENSIFQKIKYQLIIVSLTHGLISFVLQIAWNRTMVLILGSSTYSFSAVLIVFLIGLGLSAFAVKKYTQRLASIDIRAVAKTEIVAGFGVLAAIPMYERLVYWFVKLYPLISESYRWTFAVQFLFTVLAIIVPVFLIGLILPLLMEVAQRNNFSTKGVGIIYAANTFGALLGCLVSVFWLIPGLGINITIKLAGLAMCLLGAWLLFINREKKLYAVKPIRTIVSFVIISALLLYPWDRYIFSSGAFIYARTFTNQSNLLSFEDFKKRLSQNNELLFYKDGFGSTVTVVQYPVSVGDRGSFKGKSIKVNGKVDASTFGDMPTQLSLGYFPLFANPMARKALVIGLGAGITLDSVTRFKNIERIDCVEIEPAVAQANRYFYAENNNALKDPRVRLILADGRNHLMYARGTYDVIISEPSNPWIAGVSYLFTKENYESALKKLSSDGVFCQWFHAYQMSVEDFQMIIKTFMSVFPEVNLFRVGGNDYLLLGSKKPIQFDQSLIERNLQSDAMMKADFRFFLDGNKNFIMDAFVMSGRDLNAALASEKIFFNTDDHLRLEYNAPKHLYDQTGPLIQKWLYAQNKNDYFPSMIGLLKEDPGRAVDISNVYFNSALLSFKSGNYDEALKGMLLADKYRPNMAALQYWLGRIQDEKGNHQEAVRYYQSISNTPNYETRGGSGARRAALLLMAQSNPLLKRDSLFYNSIAGLSFLMGDYPRCFNSLSLAINTDPKSARNYADFAKYLFMLGDQDEGLKMLRIAHQLDPQDASVKQAMEVNRDINESLQSAALMGLSLNFLSIGDHARARQALKDVIKMNPDNPVVYEMLARVEDSAGLSQSAETNRIKSEKIRRKWLS